MTIHFKPEFRDRLASVAESRAMSIEDFVLDVLETAIRPIECQHFNVSRDIAELEALWQRAGYRNSEPVEDGPPRQ